MDNTLTEIRKYKSHQYEHFVYKNTCLLKSILVKKARELRSVSLIINGVELQPSSENLTHFVFNFKAIRENLRSVFGFDQAENDLLCLEETLGYNGFLSMNYYSAVPVAEIKNTVFTSALQIAFKPKAKTLPQFIEVEEEVYKPTKKV
jgi:hypothetical protein